MTHSTQPQRTPRSPRNASSLSPVGLPQPVSVTLDADGVPVTVTRLAHRGHRPQPVRVESVEEVWRVAEAWWREAPQRRTYYRLLLADGRLLTLFHDGRRDTWHEQRYGQHDDHRQGAGHASQG